MVTSRSGGVDDIMKKRKKRTFTSSILFDFITSMYFFYNFKI